MEKKETKEEDQPQIDENNQNLVPQEEKPKVQDPPEVRFKNYLEETGISEAFQIILAEILQKQIKKQFICHYAAQRLRQIGQELENIKQQGNKPVDIQNENRSLIHKSPKNLNNKKESLENSKVEKQQKKPVGKAK